MNRIKSLSIVLGSALVFTVLAFEFFLTSERPKSKFSSYEEVKASGLIEKGWIPPFIPESSFNIKEQHDLDTNTVTMSFEYDVNDKEKTKAACVSERNIENGIELKCVYYLSDVTIELFNNGMATLNSHLTRRSSMDGHTPAP